MSLPVSYARALHESVEARSNGQSPLEAIEGELRGFARLLEESDQELRIALFGPVTPSAAKEAIVGELAKCAGLLPIVQDFVKLVARKGRLALLGQMADSFGRIRLEAEGGMRGQVVSAEKLEEKDLADLAAAFSRKTGKKVEFQTEYDPGLLAGVKVILGGVTYDGTLRTQLRKLRDHLVQGAEPRG